MGARCTCTCPEHVTIRELQLRRSGGKMHYTITRAGLLKKRFRARLIAGNGELVWHTQTYADVRDAYNAIHVLQDAGANFPIREVE
jgi:uncharacterized protein YegP (UPF0339 family)